MQELSWHNGEDFMVSKAMVMAAGVGSRLDPLTQDIPKPLVPIANRPVMDILLERLAEVSIKDVVANTYYLSDKIIEHYKNSSIDINFNYIKEEELSGTAGGVKKCQFFFTQGEDFLILSADGLSNADLKAGIDSHKKSGAIASIGIKKIAKEEIPNFGVVVTDQNGAITQFQEKPTLEEAKSDYINTGIYIFNYEIFNHIPENTFYDFAKNVFPSLMQKGLKINTFVVKEYWSDIGTIDQYIQSTHDLFKNEYKINHSEIINTKNGSYIKGESQIPHCAELLGINTIGHNCNIGKNVLLENCIIWDRVEIKDNIKLKNCVIASDCTIEESLSEKIIGPNQLIKQSVCKSLRKN